MKVKSLGKNITELQRITKSGSEIVLISYETPVALIRWLDDYRRVAIITDQFHSVTTSRHINQWLIDHNLDIKNVNKKDQNFFNDLLN